MLLCKLTNWDLGRIFSLLNFSDMIGSYSLVRTLQKITSKTRKKCGNRVEKG